MRVRVKATIRNDHMISARQRLGWSQSKLAEYAGCPLRCIGDLERLNFEEPYVMRHVESVADTLGLSIQEVAPDDLVGRRVKTDLEKVAEVSTDMLLAADRAGQLSLPSPQDLVDAQDQIDDMMASFDALSPVQQKIIELRYGLNGHKTMTLGQIGKVVGLTKERVRQIMSNGQEVLRKQVEQRRNGCIHHQHKGNADGEYQNKDASTSKDA